jgi:hypothetical protein
VPQLSAGPLGRTFRKNLMTRFLLFLTLCLSTICFSQQQEDMTDNIQGDGNENRDVVEYVKQQLQTDVVHYIGDTRNCRKIDSLITPVQLDYTGLFEGDFDSIVRNNSYAFLFDIDEDKTKELIFLQVVGSLRIPHFFVCRIDSIAKKYRVSKCIKDKYLFPLTFKNHLYFIDKADDFNSKRIKSVTIYDITKRFNLIKKASLNVKYSYRIPDSLKPYIRSDFLESLPKSDLKHLSKRTFLRFLKDEHQILFDNDDMLTFKIHYTSVGYYQTTMDIELEINGGESIKYEGIFGFDIIQSNRNKFLVISEEDDRNRVMGIMNMKISVISFTTLHIVRQGFLIADISIKSAP